MGLAGSGGSRGTSFGRRAGSYVYEGFSMIEVEVVVAVRVREPLVVVIVRTRLIGCGLNSGFCVNMWLMKG